MTEEKCTDLIASGEVEVDEVAAAFSSVQVGQSLLCYSVAVGQAQVLKVDTAPVSEQQSISQVFGVCFDFFFFFKQTSLSRIIVSPLRQKTLIRKRKHLKLLCDECCCKASH